MTSVLHKAVLRGRIAGQVETRNIFYGETDIVLPDTPGSVAKLYITGVLNPIITYISSLWANESIDIYAWVAGEWAFIMNEPFAGTGASSSDILPYQNAAVLLGKTLAKRKLGRKFIAGFAENSINGATFSGAVLTALGTAALAYVSTYTTVAGSVWQPGIVTKGGTYYAFVSGAVSALMGSMRRRKPGLGI